MTDEKKFHPPAHAARSTSSNEPPEVRSGSDLPVDPLYVPASIDPDWEYAEQLGSPGQFPFTRGIYPTGYRGKLWTMRQYAGFGTAEESNRRYRYLLDHGTTGLSVAFDLPTQIGYDSDDDMALGEVGKVGVAISSLADMEMLFAGIPLNRISTSMTINAPATVLLAMYIAVAEKQGIPPEKLAGTTQNDILKEYIARGTYIFPPRPSMRLVTDVFAYCRDQLPRWNTISISGYHIREAGCTAVQEIAFTLADGIAYVEAARQVGLEVDDFAPRLSFFFNAHNDLLEEVAKFRAARRLWARIMRDRFGAKKPESMMLRFHTQTAGSMLTAQQPENNIVRVTLQALAAVLGGTQSLHTNSMDEALALPSDRTVRIALRTQQVIAYESGVAASSDPLAGSYLIESATDRLEALAEETIARVDRVGGMVRAIESGLVQREIQDAAYRWQQSLESGERVLVGVNRFQVEETDSPALLKVDPAIRADRVDLLRKLRDERDNSAVTSALDALESAARETHINLMPPILSAVRVYATLGEICGRLRNVFGEYSEAPLA